MKLLPKQKFLLAAPVIVLPFLLLIFYALGGGRAQGDPAVATTMGLNKQLPGTWLSTRQMLINKIKAYEKADLDSARKKESEQRDPYHSHIMLTKKDSLPSDPKANELLRQLDRLQKSMRQPSQPAAPVFHPYSPPVLLPQRHVADTPENDPQLDRLNNMLDKVIRIQHPAESKAAAALSGNQGAETLLPADSGSNAISAIVPTDQTLVTGGTISLRLAEDAVIHGITIPKGEWIYGTVAINNDRLLVHIQSLRNGNNLYSIELQVYDLDGLAGIHIPGMLSRDVAKESANEGVNSLNLATYDPSLGAQAANAGIQAGKTLFGRKVRLIRVSVRAGYQVLLRSNQSKSLGFVKTRPLKDSSSCCHLNVKIQPPGFVPGGSFIQRCRTEGMELDLKGIYLQDSLLWMALRWDNHSPIDYVPDYYRWVIRDKRSFKRTAVQELPVEPMYSPERSTVQGDSTATQWVGFRPFALSKDKELVLEAGEKNGGRTLMLVIDHRRILHAKICDTHETTPE